MIGSVGIPELLSVMFLVAGVMATVWPAARVFRRLGYPRWFGVLVLVPGVNLLLLWYVALARWPSSPTARDGAGPF